MIYIVQEFSHKARNTPILLIISADTNKAPMYTFEQQYTAWSLQNIFCYKFFSVPEGSCLLVVVFYCRKIIK